MPPVSLTCTRAAVTALLMLLPLAGRAQNPDVYLVKASDCTQAPVRRALTGFRVRGLKGIVTALHGVADSRTITVTSVGGKSGGGRVTVYEVDVPHDLARLSSPAFERLPSAGLTPAPPAQWQSLGSVTVTGYPLGVDLQDLTTPLTVGSPPLKVLRTLVDAPTRLLLQGRHSPDPSLLVLYLVGFLHPGHSGAPILDRSGRLVAVGDGGLKVFSGTGWAIPWKGLTWRPANGESRLTVLRQRASVGLFSFDSDPQAAEQRIAALLQPQLKRIAQDTAQIPALRLNVAQAVALLQSELKVKDKQIEFLQGLITTGATPSARARELAAQIPLTADPYALALKAIAEQRFEDARKLLDRVILEKETNLARFYQARGETEYYAGRYTDAVVWYRKAQVLQPDAPGPANDLGYALLLAGKFAEAESFYQQALAILQKTLGPEHPDTVTALSNLAGAYLDQSKYAQAEPLYRQALAIREKVLGPRDPETAAGLNNLAELEERQGKYAQAEPLFRRALAIMEEKRGSEHPSTATSLNNLAELEEEQGQYAQAEPLLVRALAIREKVLGPEHPDTATSLANLAAVYLSRSKFAEAEPLYQRALGILEKALGPEHPSTATALSNLAGVYRSQSNYAQAEPLYQQALAIREKVLGPEHPDTATSLNNLAAAYSDQNKFDQAEPLLVRALAIREKSLGLEHPDTAASLTNLGALYENQSKYAQAEPLYQRALAIREKALPPEHPSTVISLNNLAAVYEEQGKFAEAEPLLVRALALREKALGPEHPSTANSLSNLAFLYETQGKYAQAEPLLKRALTVREKALGPEHPNVASLLEHYAVLLRKTGRAAEAQPMETRAKAIRKKQAESMPSPSKP